MEGSGGEPSGRSQHAWGKMAGACPERGPRNVERDWASVSISLSSGGGDAPG